MIQAITVWALNLQLTTSALESQRLMEKSWLTNQTVTYPAEGGIHPREAASHHAEVADKVLKEALIKSWLKTQ